MKAHQTWKRAASAAAVAAIALVAATALADDPPTTPSNHDPDSFGNNMVFLGVTATPSVFFYGSCTDPDPDLPFAPPNRCVVVGPSSATTFAFPDLASIYIPPRSAKTIIWPTFILSTEYQLINNDLVSSADGIFRTNIIFTIESDVLSDPSVKCLDLKTGAFVGCNGRLVTNIPNVYSEEHTLAPGARALKRVRSNSTAITGMATTSTLQGTTNLSAKAIKKMFESPMTIRIGLSGRVQNVDPDVLNFVFVGLRLIGDR